jgi:hypothetical protein
MVQRQSMKVFKNEQYILSGGPSGCQFLNKVGSQDWRLFGVWPRKERTVLVSNVPSTLILVHALIATVGWTSAEVLVVIHGENHSNGWTIATNRALKKGRSCLKRPHVKDERGSGIFGSLYYRLDSSFCNRRFSRKVRKDR